MKICSNRVHISIWADIQPESIPQGLGSHWDVSRTPKPLRKIPKSRFSGIRRNSTIPPNSPFKSLIRLWRQDSNLVCGQGGLVRPSGVGVACEPPTRTPGIVCLLQRCFVSATQRHYVVSIQQIFDLYIADVQVVECQNLDKHREILFESGPYALVRAHIQPESIPQALGSLWDASRTPKSSGKKRSRFSRIMGNSPSLPISLLKGK